MNEKSAVSPILSVACCLVTFIPRHAVGLESASVHYAPFVLLSSFACGSDRFAGRMEVVRMKNEERTTT